MLAQEASIDKNNRRSIHLCLYGDLKDELDYIYNHMSERLTLRISRTNSTYQNLICLLNFTL